MPVDEEKVRLQDRQRNRWTPVRVEPQRVFLSWLQWGHATAPSRRFSIAPIACIRASSERSAARRSFNCGPVRLPSVAQSLLNDLASMIAPPSKRRAKALRIPLRYQNKPETTRLSDMATSFRAGSELDFARYAAKQSASAMRMRRSGGILRTSRSCGEVSLMSPIQIWRRTAAMASVKVKAFLRYQAAA